MKKYKTLFIVLGIVVFFVLIASLGRLTNKSTAAGIILFYGDTCPHCKNVDDYLNSNDVRNKISFKELEVYNNKDNAALLINTAKQCGLETANGVGVPFLFDGTNCLLGDQPIIDFFTAKIK